jgi:hypothetical protein
VPTTAESWSWAAPSAEGGGELPARLPQAISAPTPRASEVWRRRRFITIDAITPPVVTSLRRPCRARHGIHVHGDGPVGKRLLQDDADEAIGAVHPMLLGDGRTKDVAAEGLAPLLVHGVSAGRGVEGKAVVARAEGLVVTESARHERGERCALPPPFRPRWRRAAGCRGRHQHGQPVRLGLVVWAALKRVKQPSAPQVLDDARHGALGLAQGRLGRSDRLCGPSFSGPRSRPSSPSRRRMHGRCERGSR